MAKFHPLTVKHIKSLTPNSLAITFNVPKELIQTFDFVPGQYVTLKKEIKGKELRRSYSICSFPRSDCFTIGVKKVDKGVFTHFAHTQLTVGDILEVMPPEGRFTFQSTGQPKTIAAFAAGSGITPIMSIAKAVLDSHPKSKFVLVYGNKSFKDTMFYTDLVKLELDHSDRFFVHFVTSQTQEDDSRFGRIDTAMVNFALKNKHKDSDFDAYYLCGPEAMIDLVSDTLVDNDVPKDKIHFELFTSEGITDEMPQKPDGQTQLTVTVDDEVFELTMDKKERVLDAVLKQNIDAPYSCQGGVCSTCIARVTEGKAEMAKNQILTDGEIEEGFILTCQAHPLTATLKVNYDDV